MSRGAILFLILFFATPAFTQNAAVLLKEAETLEHQLKEQEAFDKYKAVLKIEPRNYIALWKCSELCSRIGNRQSTKSKKSDYFSAGRTYAEIAIKVNPTLADAYYALSVAMGRKALIESGNDKVKAVREIKTNADKAVQLNPNYGRAWHVIGKWNYEVYNLSGFEKAALKVFYGGLPPASLNNAINAYEKARKLEPNFALNNLELAKAYHKNDEDAKAIALLKQLPSFPEKTLDDAQIKQEGKKLLEKLED
jgi:tetratricopeptide (TPR) repeat protein